MTEKNEQNPEVEVVEQEEIKSKSRKWGKARGDPIGEVDW